jgi:ATP synthase protein I
MSDPRSPSDDRLRDLTARADALERATARPVTASSAANAATSQGYRIVADLLGGVIVGLALGFGVDWLAPRLLGVKTAPAGLLLGVLAGFAVSVWMAKQTADRLVAQAKRDNPNPPSVPDADDET